MTAQIEIDPVEEAATIAAQNDTFRRTILPSGQQQSAPQGKIVMTQGISALGPDVQQALVQQVAAFEAFNEARAVIRMAGMKWASSRSPAPPFGSRSISMTQNTNTARRTHKIWRKRATF